MKIAIVDDERKSAELIMSYIARFQEESGEVFDVKYFGSGLEFMDTSEPFDLVFMDIAMPHINGMETARELRRRNDTCSLIFITNMAQYAIEGYEVEALDFLLKPVEYFNFSVKLKRALRVYTARQRHFISVPMEDGSAYLAVDDIYYIEVIAHSIIFHTTKTVLESRKNALKTYEQQLAGLGFSRCNYNYLVNLKYVTRSSGDSIFVGGDELKISRNRKKSFMKALADYIGAT